MARDNGEFHLGRCPEIIDHCYDAPAIAGSSLFQDFRQQRFRQLIGRLQLRRRHAWFVVNTEAKFHLVSPKLEAAFSDGGGGASGKGNAHGGQRCGLG